MAKTRIISTCAIKKHNDHQELYTSRNDLANPILKNTLHVLFILKKYPYLMPYSKNFGYKKKFGEKAAAKDWQKTSKFNVNSHRQSPIID